VLISSNDELPNRIPNDKVIATPRPNDIQPGGQQAMLWKY